MDKTHQMGQFLLLLALTIIAKAQTDNFTDLPPPGAIDDIKLPEVDNFTALPPPGAIDDIDLSELENFTALPPPGAIDDIDLSENLGDDDLGPPITREEIAAAMADSSLTDPPKGAIDAIEHSGEFQGDIKLTLAQQVQMRMGGRSAILSDAWANGIIPYTISSVFTTSERQVIARAMAEYENRTCIRFVERTIEVDYISIVSSSGCWSYVGRVGGRQLLSLRRSGCVHFGVAIHEFMHAAGFWHEQSRYDRDNYVIINFENIQSGRENNFDKRSRNETTDLATKYDCGSVMHYSATAFSKNGRPTIVSKNCKGTLGQRNGFSQSDVVGLNRRYNCAGRPCRNARRCKRQGGECQPTWSPCSGTIVKRGCKKRGGCACCVPAKAEIHE